MPSAVGSPGYAQCRQTLFMNQQRNDAERRAAAMQLIQNMQNPPPSPHISNANLSNRELHDYECWQHGLYQLQLNDIGNEQLLYVGFRRVHYYSIKTPKKFRLKSRPSLHFIRAAFFLVIVSAESR